MKTPEVIATTVIGIPAILFAGCNDFRVTNELKDPYNASLSIKNKNHIRFSCEEGYLTEQSSEAEILKRIDALAKNSCDGGFIREDEKLKSLTINPGEYYHKVSASFRCKEQLVSDFDIDATALCRSILGSSYRSLSASEK